MTHRQFLRLAVSLSILAATLVSQAAHGGANRLIQPKLFDLLDIAEVAMNQGNVNKALAYSDLLLLNNTITYSIDTGAVAPDQRDEAAHAVRESVATWEEALGYEVQFEEVSKGGNVRIAFADSVRLMGKDIAGHAVWSRQVFDWGYGNYTPRVSGEIKVRIVTPEGSPMSEAAWQHTIGHEIGHMLGLWDSPRVGDMMGPINLKNPVTRPTESEVAALQGIRAEALQITQACLALPRR